MQRLNLPVISPKANKYTRGSLLIIGGSTRFPGAAILAALAGALSGAGYTTLATPISVVPTAQAHLLSIPVIGAQEMEGAFGAHAFSSILEKLNHINAVVLGPGLTSAPSALDFARSVQIWADKTSTPLVLDADALMASIPSSASSRHPHSSSESPTASPSPDSSSSLAYTRRRILTPHAGELTRLLTRTGTSSVEELANHQHAIVIAKGPVTTITDRQRMVSCNEGTPALAKAGTGDVLSGIIGSLLAQGMDAFEAAEAAVIIHAHAGQYAEEKYGTRSVMAEHLLEALPAVLRDALA